MKRIFLSVCAAAALILFMESCQKEVPVVDNTPSVISPDDGTDDEPEPDPADLLPIKIDAEFAGKRLTPRKLPRQCVRKGRQRRLSRR